MWLNQNNPKNIHIMDYNVLRHGWSLKAGYERGAYNFAIWACSVPSPLFFEDKPKCSFKSAARLLLFK